MRRYARSGKRRKIFLRIREGEQEEATAAAAAGAADIGSWVFPFRTAPPAPAPMPTVGTRRSTRVFVPKQQQRLAAGDGDAVGVLRSGKRFGHSMALKDDDGNAWLQALGGVDGDGSDLNRCWRDEGKIGWKEETEEIEKGIDEKKLFGVVYSRKRRRSTVNDVKDRKFGIVFERRHRKKEQRARPCAERVTGEYLIVDDGLKRAEYRVREFCVGECSKTSATKLGILDSDLWSGLECGPVVLAVLVDSSVSYSLDRFEHLLVSVMKWMRRAGAELLDLVAFLFHRSISHVFSVNGIHFLPIRHPKDRILGRNSLADCGFCKIYGAKESIPLLSVDYFALPSYFKCLHAIVFVGSLYLPRILRSKHLVSVPENSLVVAPYETHAYGDHPSELEFQDAEFTVSETLAVNGDKLPTLGDSLLPVSQNLDIISCSKLRKHQKKRSSLKNTRARNPSAICSHFGSFRSIQNGSSKAKRDAALGPVSVKLPDSCLSDLYSGREESDAASSPGSSSKPRKSTGTKSPIEKTKDLRLALAEVRHNIDSACCNANILVSDGEKCWREDGAQVRLEMSGSQEWFIAVKRGNVTRFLHKPQDLRSYSCNRFTHAYMWSGDDGWKLEFCEKWDWYVFKELHTECRDRNEQDVPVKVIPVPGVREVSGYDDGAMPSFVRPDIYIHMIDDEVGRALRSENSYYDMDSADEEWLRHLNSSLSDAQDGGFCYLSEENFERIIFSLEKDAYSCSDDAFDKERVLCLWQELGTRETVSAIYDYWLKKRKQKRAPLVRIFQGPPLKRAQLLQKPFLRKKRSFKRQRSQAERNQTEWNHCGRGKSLFLQAHQMAIRKVQESEAAANRAADFATQLRTRAQVLMSNADLLAFKAAMALRIAETIRESSSSKSSDDLDSSILFD